MKRDIFIFIHIQKCGGTTFNHILRRNFGDEFLPDYFRILHKKYSTEEIGEIINVNRSISAFSSHGFSINLPFDSGEYNITAITFVRNPIERFISHYYYHRSLEPKTAIIETTQKFSLETYIKHVVSEQHKTDLLNYQFRQLVDSLDKSQMNNIINFIQNKKLFLFPLDYFDESCLILSRFFPSYFRDCSYIRRNTSKRFIEPKTYDMIYKEFSSYFDLDIKLYEIALKELKSTLSSIFESEFEIARNISQLQRKSAFSKPFLLVNGAIRVTLRRFVELSYKLERIKKSNFALRPTTLCLR